MKSILLTGVLAVVATAQTQRIERWDLRSATDGLRLYAWIDNEDRLISNRALAAWDGWLPHTLIYAERAPGSTLARLRWYDAFTRNSHTIASNEPLEYTQVATARLSNGEYALMISLLDRESRIPYIELAGSRSGVFLRESHAAFGVAANDVVQVLRYAPADVEQKRGDLSLLSPAVTARVSLLPPAKPRDATGLYEVALTAERTVTLNLRSGGTATLAAPPEAVRGKWTQQGYEVRFTPESGAPMTWVLGANGLTPKQWDRAKWSNQGLILRRVQ